MGLPFPFLFGFILAVAYWPGIAGAASTPRWVLLSALPVAVIALDPGRRFTVAHLAGALFLGWCVVSIVWAEAPLDAVDALWKWGILAFAFQVGFVAPDAHGWLYRGLACGLGLSSVLAILTVIGFPLLPTLAGTEAPAGLFVNPNFLAEACALVAAALIGRELWGYLPLVAPGLLLTHARGAALAMAAALAVWIWRYSRWAALGLVVLTGSIIATYAKPASGMGPRFAIWSDTINGLTWLGHGVGSYWEAFPAYATMTDLSVLRPEHAHNEFMETAFELGWIGLALSVLFLATLSPAAWRQYRKGQCGETLILIAGLTAALFAFPFHNPVTGFVCALAYGYLARDVADVGSVAGFCRSRVRSWVRPDRLSDAIGSS